MDILVQFLTAAFLAVLTLSFVFELVRMAQNAVLVRKNVDLDRRLLGLRVDQIMDARKFENQKREHAWDGVRKFEVMRKVDEGGGIASFYLTPHDRKPLPPYLPGQYLTFHISIPDAIAYPGGRRAGTKTTIRCYSLSDSPFHPDYYRVTIKKVPPPPNRPEIPPGIVSSYFHDHIKEGDILDVKAPAGNFYLDLQQQHPVVMIAGGVGVTPLLSMLNALAESGSRREVWFFYCVRNHVGHVMKGHFEETAKNHPNVRLHVCYTDPAPENVEGRDYQHAERVSVELFKRLLPGPNFEFYLCGPPPMMDQIKTDLKAWGVPERKILFEAFGSASVKKMKTPEPAAGTAAAVSEVEVTFVQSNKTCRWKTGQGSLLELAEANGVRIDSGCRAGNCGTCLTAVKSGKVDVMVEHGAAVEEGSCLTCISTPKTDLVLDA